MISDNGPEFAGKSYREFSKQWDFQHDTSSTRYPESNGQVERTIQMIKKTLRKAITNDDDPYLALLATPVCPGPYDNTAPATLFFNRPIRSNIPFVNVTYRKGNKKLHRDMQQNKKLKDLSVLRLNDKVRMHDGKSWSIKGKIIDVSNKPRPYIVLTEDGSKLRRNKKHYIIYKTWW